MEEERGGGWRGLEWVGGGKEGEEGQREGGEGGGWGRGGEESVTGPLEHIR